MASLIQQTLKLNRCLYSLSGNLSYILRQIPAGNRRFTVESPASYVTDAKARSPFDSNIIRILRTEIDYQYDYGPPNEATPSYESFSIEERPGQEFIRLKRKFGENEDIKIEATMFDGCVSHPKAGDDNDGENIQLHISLLVDIYKGEGSDGLGFVCSAWPDGLEILKVYTLRSKLLSPKAHMGPNLRKVDPKLRKALHDYLKARGVNEELSCFLHHYMVNKDRSELFRWLNTLKSFVEM
ncbi:uncharacterized protein At2g39795, mitochondrial-like [Silene latifolia]|uniref:uncharacterized protein At2g39795, mitochondrial-like n=1 Tax=Silene latifolia TaxID=37657 RepID=UPI003D78772D